MATLDDRSQGDPAPESPSATHSRGSVPSLHRSLASSTSLFLSAMPAAIAIVAIVLLYAFDSFAFDPPMLLTVEASQSTGNMSPSEVADTRFAVWKYQFIVNSFEWHQRSTRLIFWTSMVVIAAGLGFSAWQFLEASHADHVAQRADEMELKYAAMSVAFKSRSLATFMVFISVCYLVIYVTLVYPIRSLNVEPMTPTPYAGNLLDQNAMPDEAIDGSDVEVPTLPPPGWNNVEE